MASRKTLNAKNLQALGARRLAELLIEISAGDAVAKRRLRLELAGRESPAAVASEVRKRLAAIGRARSFVDRRRASALANDLETQRRAITGPIAGGDPAEGFETMWRFLSLASPVLDRCDDSDGAVSEVFSEAVGDLGRIAGAARPEPGALADRVLETITANDYGQYDSLIQLLAPAMGPVGLKRLRQGVIALSKEPVRKPDKAERRIIGYSSRGPIYEDDLVASSRKHTVQAALKDIADALGDADAYAAQYDEEDRKVPQIAAAIARRFLDANRAAEALDIIDAADARQGHPYRVSYQWDDARIDALEALGRGDEAQQHRWACFERSLSVEHLRAHLKRLSDFDAIGAEERAFDHAQDYANPHAGLAFLISWPDLDRAGAHVIRRAAEFDGNRYEYLTPAADALADRQPLAATIMLRAMIDFTLENARPTRYGHASRHFAECARLAHGIEDFGTFETHSEYASRLRREHERKRAFWNLAE